MFASFKPFNKSYRLLVFFLVFLIEFLVFFKFLEFNDFDRDACAAATIAIGIL
jgi:hypothetical protein